MQEHPINSVCVRKPHGLSRNLSSHSKYLERAIYRVSQLPLQLTHVHRGAKLDESDEIYQVQELNSLE